MKISDYPQDLKFFDLVYKTVIAKMKDLLIYSLIYVDSKETKKAK